MKSISVVIPSLDDMELFGRSLPALLAEVERRGLGDELWVVDDTGRGVLEEPLGRAYPQVRVLSNETNQGFARALLAGVRAASHELVLCLNPDVVVRPGSLDPLVGALEDADVAAAVPRLLLDGVEQDIESDTSMVERKGVYSVVQPSLGEGTLEEDESTLPVAFAVGGACLLRRAEFLERGGFDPLYEPFYWEDVDLGLAAWRGGRRVLLVRDSTFEHHHRGTIGKVVPRPLVRAAQERNRLLCQWKYLSGEAEWRAHVDALVRWAVDAWLDDQREELEWLVLALSNLDQVFEARAGLQGGADAPGLDAPGLDAPGLDAPGLGDLIARLEQARAAARAQDSDAG